MKQYKEFRSYDVLLNKNPQENEVRSEIISTPAYFDSNCVNIKSTHNKRKEYR